MTTTVDVGANTDWLDEGNWRSSIYLDGWRAGIGGSRAVVEPATGDELGRLGLAGPADVTLACARATLAGHAWAALPYTERARVLRRAGDLWTEHTAEISDWIIREAGSVPAKAEIELRGAAEECYEAAALASHPSGEVLRSAQPRLSFARRRPVGVVGVIAPFNFPLTLSIRSVAPALALGNAVVLKPDPRTGVSGGVALARIFEEAGLPPGVLSVLPGGVDVGEAIITDARVRVVAFTGSTRAGRRVATLAAEYLTRVHLELGGNSALIVMSDVDVEKAASIGAFGSFLHQGQICMTTGRHLVDAAIAEDYIAALAAHADALPVGDPATGQVALGPIIDANQRDHIHGLVTDTVRQGARLVAGGSYDGLFYRPTVLADVTVDAPAWAREVFGPVAPVIGFHGDDEAIALAADSEYGLSLGILSGDGLRALELSARIPAGLVHINDQTVADEAVIPFGGMRASGNGSRMGGIQGNLDAYTETQWVTAQSALPDYPF
jgi:benzaldehyde dehydrogenase (NAD)